MIIVNSVNDFIPFDFFIDTKIFNEKKGKDSHIVLHQKINDVVIRNLSIHIVKRKDKVVIYGRVIDPIVISAKLRKIQYSDESRNLKKETIIYSNGDLFREFDVDGLVKKGSIFTDKEMPPKIYNFKNNKIIGHLNNPNNAQSKIFDEKIETVNSVVSSCTAYDQNQEIDLYNNVATGMFEYRDNSRSEMNSYVEDHVYLQGDHIITSPNADSNIECGEFTTEDIDHEYYSQVLWGMGVYQDMLFEKFGRKNIPNSTDTYIMKCNVSYEWAIGAQYIYESDKVFISRGYPWEGNDLYASLDAVGHEFPHALIRHEANFDFPIGVNSWEEWHGLEEGIADIFGTYNEYYASQNYEGVVFDYLLGEDFALVEPLGIFRSMIDPESVGDPDTYDGNFQWMNPHTQSGVINHMFYLLSEGGTGVNDVEGPYDVCGIGIENAVDIIYKALTDYLYETSDFSHYRVSCLMAAEDIYGYNSYEYFQTLAAFDAVNIDFEFENFLNNGRIELDDLIVDEPKMFHGTIVVPNNKTLTITSTVYFSPNAQIIVERGGKLIVDGGLLTTLCDERWKGIVVEGDAVSGNQNNAGYVELKNNAILENAIDLISMHPTHIPWPATQDHWGGVVRAENTTFRNCKRAVAFMKYGTGFIKDQSKFTNCTFENIEYTAVTFWADNGVTFDGCTFDDIGNSGIYAYDTEVIVENGCQFTNQHTGVDVFTTYPIPFAPRIGNINTKANDFQCSNYGVFMQSQGNIKPLEVKNNNFLGSTYGVHINGLTNFQIEGNDFSGGYAGIEPVSTGFTHSNYVTFNNISSSAYGSHAAYDNSNLEYLDNCFGYSNFSDIYINNGAIWLSQGSIDVANGNCFSKGGVPEIDNTGNDEIELHVWSGEPATSCEYPTVVNDNDSYNVNVLFDSPTSNVDNCGSSFSPGIINVRTFCKGPFKTKQSVLNKIAEIEALIEDVNNNPNLSQSYKNYLIRIYKRCLSSLQVHTVIIILEPSSEDPDGLPETERIEAAIDYISQVADFNLQILAYGLMVNTNQIDRARLFLNSLTRSTLEQNNFVLAQNINLDYLSDTHNYVLSSNDESLLYSIGIGIEPLDGYARSIYEVLKGDRIELSIPDPHNSVRPRIAIDGDISTNVEFSVYPNPASEDYVIIETNSSSDNTICEIFDINGKLMLNQILDQSSQNINTSNWHNGMYFVVIKDKSGSNIHTSKLLLTH
ncbi:MAG: M4 family metallopeptidase [Saprospiraceae bacterium]